MLNANVLPTQDAMRLPMVPLRGMSVFPYMLVHFDVARASSINAMNQAMEKDQLVFLVTQRDAMVNEPTLEGLYPVGVVARIRQLMRIPGGSLRVLAEGLNRARIMDFYSEADRFEAEIAEQEEIAVAPSAELEAARKLLLERFETFSDHSPVAPEVMQAVSSITNIGHLTDTIAAKALYRVEDEQEILGLLDPMARIERLCVLLSQTIELLELEGAIERRVKEQVDHNQKEYFLREQLKIIRRELGDEPENEVDALRVRMDGLPLPEEARRKMEKELDRLSILPVSSPEYSVSRGYIDTILDLPWGKESTDNYALDHARRVLEEDHYGLADVKERILEYLAVHALTRSMKGSVLCLVGPPGVGKTSIAQSVARALGRQFVRMSLGGVRDEAEIRGHRRTYVGAIPGRIVTSVKQAGSMNPLMLLDEIDKLSSDLHGDPASALLEVLDGEQNDSFRDHYLDIPFDLSKVFFLVTANTLDTVPRPLLDRMEVIEISSYTSEEKLMIARRHLLPKQCAKHGLAKGFLRMDEAAIREVIEGYTRESGVRNLERMLGKICRKAAMACLDGKKALRVTAKRVPELLGAPPFHREAAGREPLVGTVNGLAWTSVGGETLTVEALPMKGTGQLMLTGHLGDVMQESAKAAVSYIRAHAKDLGIAPDFYKDIDLHIHVPEGATPKDGPSAGVTLFTAVTSALSGRPVRQDVAMTGEITLRGRVLPIGGLKEKTMAAFRAGISTVLYPSGNLHDTEKIPQNVRSALHMIPVDTVDDVLPRALMAKPRGDETP